MSEPAEQFYEFGPFRLEPLKRRLWRDGLPVPLQPKALDILLVLVEHNGRVLDKDELINKVWPDTVVEESNLAHHISALRKALGDRQGAHHYIVTLSGRGYRFVAEVRQGGYAGADLVVARRARSRVVIEEETAVMAKVAPASRAAEAGQPAEPRRRALLALALLPLMAALGFVVYRLAAPAPGPSRPAEPPRQIQMKRFTTSGNAITAAVSPDGRYVAYVTEAGGRQSLWVRQTAAAGAAQVVPPAETYYYSLAFSPDGNHVFYIAWEWNKAAAALYQVPTLGGAAPRRLLPEADGFCLSPDGSRVAYVVESSSAGKSELLVANADGSGSRRLAVRQHPEFFFLDAQGGPAWSPDGKTIACPAGRATAAGRHMSVVAVNVEDGAERPLTAQEWFYVGRVAWLADGGGLMFTAREQLLAPRQVWLLAHPGGAARRITHDLNDYSSVSLTADGRLLAVQTEPRTTIWVAPDGDAARATPVVSEVGHHMEAMAWTPDGRIVYSSSASGNSDVWVMEADGAGQQQLTFDAATDFHPAVSPDGRHLIFASDRAGNFNIWRMDVDGGNLMRLTGGVGEVRPQVSPDGRWVVYQHGFGAGKITLWKVPIAGGEAVPLSDRVSIRPAISPDGERLACYAMDAEVWGLEILPLAGGPPLRRFAIPTSANSRMVRWTPDGQALAYVASEGGVSNIWTQPLDGGRPRRLTDFNADEIIYFEWSPDGRRLACARGAKTSDVVLVSDFIAQ